MAYAEAFYAQLGITVREASRCRVVAFGRSQVDTVTLRGTIGGDFYVVVNSDKTNLVDAPELVIMDGTFTGVTRVADEAGVIIDISSGSLDPTAILPGCPGGLPRPRRSPASSGSRSRSIASPYTRRIAAGSSRSAPTSGRSAIRPCASRSTFDRNIGDRASEGNDRRGREPSVSREPGAREPRAGVVSSRAGTRVYLRTLAPEDLEYLSDWAEDPFLERMVGSEFLNSYKHVYDKDPSFYEACLMDSTQIVLVIEAEPGVGPPRWGWRGCSTSTSWRATRSWRSCSPTPKAIRRGIWCGGGQAHLVLWSGRTGTPTHRGEGVRVQPPERQLAAAQRLPAGRHSPHRPDTRTVSAGTCSSSAS